MKKIHIFTVTVFSLFTSALFAQTPYASYPLDGNANDVSGNNHNGTISGSPTATTNRYSQMNKALDFNGSTDEIQLPVSFDFPTRSIIAWFNAKAIGGSQPENTIYDCDYPNIQNGITGIATIADANCGNVIRMSVDQFTYNATVNTYTWYQVAVVRTPLQVTMYVNGGPVYSGTNPNGLHSGNGSAYAYIGCSRIHDQHFNGKIDDLLVYNVALTDSDIAANYARHITVYDTVHVPKYDTTTVSVSVPDTLKFMVHLTGINPPNNTNPITVYPNPAKDHLIVNNGNISSMAGYSIKITNALGQIVFNQPVNQQQFYIDLNTWTGVGTYILYVLDTSQNVVGTKEIVLQ